MITVHPDQVFFECYHKDESSYGRLSANYDVFQEMGERAHTARRTSIEREAVGGSFQNPRPKPHVARYRSDGLRREDVDGGHVSRGQNEHPDTWVRGFLQVSSAATLPAHVVEFHPMDVHNLCLVLRRNKELIGPRSIRFKLHAWRASGYRNESVGHQAPLPALALSRLASRHQGRHQNPHLGSPSLVHPRALAAAREASPLLPPWLGSADVLGRRPR